MPTSPAPLTTALRLCASALVLAAFAASLTLPNRISWENGPVENAQVLVLLIGLGLAIGFWRTADRPRRRLWIGAAIIWAILAARELSWGAVFLPPVRMTDHGPAFSSALLWYRPAVTPVLTAITLFAFYMIARAHPIASYRVLREKHALPGYDLLGFVVAMLISTATENHMGLSLGAWPGDAQIVEEVVELAGYLFLVSGQLVVAAGLRRD